MKKHLVAGKKLRLGKNVSFIRTSGNDVANSGELLAGLLGPTVWSGAETQGIRSNRLWILGPLETAAFFSPRKVVSNEPKIIQIDL